MQSISMTVAAATMEEAGERVCAPRNRLLFVDGLRGIAALAVMGYHYYGNPTLHNQLSQVTPETLDRVLRHGWLGVQVFFVLSGFVIAYSLRNSPINLRSL